MSFLDSTFDELLDKISDPETLNPATSDPLFYFAYPPEQMLDLKKAIPRWTAKIHEKGLKVKRISLSDLLWRLIDESGRWDEWLGLEEGAEYGQINEAIRDVLRQEDSFVQAVAGAIADAPPGSVIFLTDAELLHPYIRTRTIESHLHDRIHVTTIIFYPGRRSGQYGLHFLGFYPVDGNYRSTLVGGI